MLASTLISEIKFKVVSPKDYDDFEVSSLVSDTRKVEENSIFVAIKGYTVDGHEFIPEAIRKGAKAIVVQEETDDIQGVRISFKFEEGYRRNRNKWKNDRNPHD